jgi:hypothetical protein
VEAGEAGVEMAETGDKDSRVRTEAMEGRAEVARGVRTMPRTESGVKGVKGDVAATAETAATVATVAEAGISPFFMIRSPSSRMSSPTRSMASLGELPVQAAGGAGLAVGELAAMAVAVL